MLKACSRHAQIAAHTFHCRAGIERTLCGNAPLLQHTSAHLALQLLAQRLQLGLRGRLRGRGLLPQRRRGRVPVGQFALVPLGGLQGAAGHTTVRKMTI